MVKKSILLGIAGALALATVAIAQQGAFPNYPIVGGDAYCTSTTNGTCTNTVPAGPTSLTGSEQIPANTELSGGRTPQNVLITTAALGKAPIYFATTGATGTLSASTLQGGVIFTHSTTITSAGVTLPQGSAGTVDGQTFTISANRTITTLTVNAASGDSMVANSAPTAMTASLTAAYGYKFICKKSGTACTWWRLQ